MSTEKKKFKDTKVGQWLKEKAPKELDTVGNLLPDKGVLGIVKNLLISEPAEVQKEFNEKEAEFQAELEKLSIQFEQTVTERWKADSTSDSWLSKNTRPLVMLSLLLFLYVIIACDSAGLAFEVKDNYVDLLSTLLVTTVVAYFGSRGAEKVMKTINK